MSAPRSSSPNHLNPRLKFQPRALPSVKEVVEKIRKGEVAALSRAITLLESQTDAHRAWSADLLKSLPALPEQSTFRLGISGTPGVGKSTFIEAFGLELIRRGHRIAILAVDPSSSISGGSILGDKTRMEQLSHHPAAFIRPSPSGGFLGGITRVTRETLLLCESAKFDYILVETVGVGQSEIAVHGMTDAFLLLAQPGAGDELQGIKRGILEMADLLVVNKADLLPNEAKRTAAELRRSLHLAPPRDNGWSPPVLTAAALTGTSVDAVADSVDHYREMLNRDGQLAVLRRKQRAGWLKDSIHSELLRRLNRSEEVKAVWQNCLAAIEKGETDINALSEKILATFLDTSKT
ncbi:methylmalonyl Co-A mutase-associated GTPase MeaB [Lewinellaceae bacterium SD302]|nr:methylmalonyl Co-A mutase-associated GTPase MeaB [Lewinellaceae bacterium SD302]